MIHPADPLGSVSTDGVRAGATIRWLEISGPRYAEHDAVFLERDDDSVTLNVEGSVGIYTDRQISHASWHMCKAASRGTILTLKFRTDPVGIAIGDDR